MKMGWCLEFSEYLFGRCIIKVCIRLGFTRALDLLGAGDRSPTRPSFLSCTGSAARATLPVHAGETLGVIKYERGERRQGSIVAPVATKPTLSDGMCLPTGKALTSLRGEDLPSRISSRLG